MLTTPSGNPASAISSAIANDESGVSSAGLRTTGFPAASAGPIFQLVNISGKVQGPICPATAIGARKTCLKKPLPTRQTAHFSLSANPPELRNVEAVRGT